jgi:hypothetical protein
VRADDLLTLANGAQSKVIGINKEWGPGILSPHTLSGEIVVDGILTTCYTDSLNPTLAHALLLPLRQMYTAGAKMGVGFSALAHGIPSLIRGAISENEGR